MEFKEFHNKLVYQFNTYHSKYVSHQYMIPDDLCDNIHEINEFQSFFHSLVKNKFYIHCNENFNQDSMYNNYILPTAVFLYYMHYDLSKLYRLELFIVNEKLYKTYKSTVGGEYAEGKDLSTGNKVHLLYVKQFNTVKGQGEYNTENIENTLGSLFHELMHLVDNTNFTGYKDTICIEYNFRYEEIKAKYISNLFLYFYQALTHKFDCDHTSEILSTIEYLVIKLDTLYFEIEHLLNAHYKLINHEVRTTPSACLMNDNIHIFSYSKQNIQLIKSMLQIEVIQKFLYQMEGII